MEVIKKGRKQKGWAHIYTCTGEGNAGGGCGAELRVSEFDLYETCSSHYDGSTDYYKTFCCPECGVETDVTTPISPKGKRPSIKKREAIKKAAFNNGQ